MVYYYIIRHFKFYITDDIVDDFKIFPSKILRHLIFLSDFQKLSGFIRRREQGSQIQTGQSRLHRK